MSYLFRSVIVAFQLSVALAPGAERAAESWNTCSLPTAQFRLQVPASLIHSTEATATGCSFQTSDGEFNIEAVAQTEKNNETLDARMQKEIELLSGNVESKKRATAGSFYLASRQMELNIFENYSRKMDNG